MKIHDVSLTISPDLVVWPGDPAISLERASKIEEGANANVSHIDMGVHTGTHVDAPCHFLMGAKGIDQVDINVLIGPAIVYQLDDAIDVVNAQVLQKLAIPEGTRRVLLKTRNSQYWRDNVMKFQPDFVGIDLDGANYLVEHGIQLIGIDYISVSPYKKSKPTHEVLLKKGIVIIEGLDLSEIKPGPYQLYCLPVKLKGSDGAPARTVLIEE